MGKLDEINKLLQESNIDDGERQTKTEDDDQDDLIKTKDQDDGVEKGESGEDDAEQDTGAEEKKEKLTVKGLAAKLEMTPEELYNTLEIKLSDNSVLSLSEIKDMAVKGKSADIQLDRVNKDSNTLMAQRKELFELTDLLRSEGKVSTNIVERCRQNIARQDARETQLLMAALPNWENQEIRGKEQNAIYGLVQPYGLTPTDVDRLVTDHRLVKVLRDLANAKPSNTNTIAAKDPIKPSQRGKPVDSKKTYSTKAEKNKAIAEMLGLK